MNYTFTRAQIHSLTCFIGAVLFFSTCMYLQAFGRDFFEFGLGFTTVYLPAGAVFLCILLGGVSGALGIFLVLVIFYAQQAQNSSLELFLLLTGCSVMVQFVVVRGTLLALKIPPNLENLKHSQLIILVVIFSITHSVCRHLYLFFLTDSRLGWIESRIGFATFAGVMAVLLLLWIVTRVRKSVIQFE